MMSTTGCTLADAAKGAKDSKSKGIIEKLHGLMKDILNRFSQKEQKLSMLLSAMVQRQPQLLWPLFDDMMSMAGAENTRVFAKSKLLEILTSMINKAMSTHVGKEGMHKAIVKVAALIKKVSS